MKLFTSISILVLLALCHIVDINNSEYWNELNPKVKENLSPKIEVEIFNDIEYKKDAINSFLADTIYYSYKNSELTEIYDDMN